MYALISVFHASVKYCNGGSRAEASQKKRTKCAIM